MNENYLQTSQPMNSYYGQQQNYMNNNPQYQYLMQMRQAASREGNPYYMPSTSAAPQNYIKGRPVVSIDEARASQIDLDGSLYVFTDLGNKKIYTKQINLDGTASLNTYALVETPEAAIPEYVTKDEFKKVLVQIKEALAPAAAQKEPISFDF